MNCSHCSCILRLHIKYKFWYWQHSPKSRINDLHVTVMNARRKRHVNDICGLVDTRYITSVVLVIDSSSELWPTHLQKEKFQILIFIRTMVQFWWSTKSWLSKWWLCIFFPALTIVSCGTSVSKLWLELTLEATTRNSFKNCCFQLWFDILTTVHQFRHHSKLWPALSGKKGTHEPATCSHMEVRTMKQVTYFMPTSSPLFRIHCRDLLSSFSYPGPKL